MIGSMCYNQGACFFCGMKQNAATPFEEKMKGHTQGWMHNEGGVW